MTHNCDASTIFEATHRGLHVEFLQDASGALPYANEAGQASAEEIHRVFSVVFHTCFAAVSSTDDWIGAVHMVPDAEEKQHCGVEPGSHCAAVVSGIPVGC